MTPTNPLVNVLSPRIRAYLYALLFLAALVFGIYQASDGDWLEFVGSLLAALLGLMAASNASLTPTDPGDGDPRVIEAEVEDTVAVEQENARVREYHRLLDAGYSEADARSASGLI